MTVERVLVTGSREWTNADVIREALSPFLPGTLVAHGAARGADTLAGVIAKGLYLKVERYPVDTKVDGPWPGAGTKRNTRMLADFKPTVCLAFPTEESRGTWDMVVKCRAAGVPVRVFKTPA